MFYISPVFFLLEIIIQIKNMSFHMHRFRQISMNQADYLTPYSVSRSYINIFFVVMQGLCESFSVGANHPQNCTPYHCLKFTRHERLYIRGYLGLLRTKNLYKIGVPGDEVQDVSNHQTSAAALHFLHPVVLTLWFIVEDMPGGRQWAWSSSAGATEHPKKTDFIFFFLTSECV